MSLCHLVALLAGCAASPPPGFQVSLAGAQIPVEMVESWLAASRRPYFGVAQVMPVYLSMHGFENLAAGNADLACTDRLMTRRELESFGGRGVAGRRVAFYGYGLYVNAANPVDSIFSRHLKMVFQRRIQDWADLAGPKIDNFAGPIKLYGPQKGTRAGQALAPLAKIWVADATWQELDTDEQIVQAVAEDPLALGFASIGFDHGVRYLGLRMDRTDRPAFPSIEEIENERYGLAKMIYVYYLDPPTPAVQAVLDYLASEPGRRAIESTGVWAVAPERAAAPSPR
ncbi:MAG: substrate-binding domain-containing protein [Phycisphaerales bacterium]|nr:substrate-binding domain-containing protein [Phycisphaerales bacterium]